MTGWRLATRALAVLAAAVTWLLWTAGSASACTVTYQSGLTGDACGGVVPAIAAGTVAAVAAAGTVGVVAVAGRAATVAADLATLDAQLTSTPVSDAAATTATESATEGGLSQEEIAFQETVVNGLNLGDPVIWSYYRNMKSPGTIPRQAELAKIGRFFIPSIELGSDGNYRVRPRGKPKATPASYRLGADGKRWSHRGGRSGIVHATLADLDRLSQARFSNLKKLAGARKDADGLLPSDSIYQVPPNWDLMGEACFLATLWGELLGTHAGVHAADTYFTERLAERFPGCTLERVFAGQLHGRDVLDDIYRVRVGDRVVGMLVLEAKGPSAELGARDGSAGGRYEQGHLEYLKTVIEVMRTSGRYGSVPDELLAALETKTLGYFRVQALVAHDRIGLSSDEMTGTNLDAIARQADEVVREVREERPDLTPEEAKQIHLHASLGMIKGTATYAGFEATQFDIGFPWP
jgi:hypothetical protein